jgi:hypothetical protein
MNQTQVIQYVRAYLDKKGYSVSGSHDGYGVGVDIVANRNHEKFLIEAVGETPTRNRSGQDIIIAIGEIVKRMKGKEPKVNYGIALPKSHMKFLKNFEVGGIQILGLHLFIVETFIAEPFGLTYHLDTPKVIELVQQLKTGKTVYLSLMDIDYKPLAKQNPEVINGEKQNENP